MEDLFLSPLVITRVPFHLLLPQTPHLQRKFSLSPTPPSYLYPHPQSLGSLATVICTLSRTSPLPLLKPFPSVPPMACEAIIVTLTLLPHGGDGGEVRPRESPGRGLVRQWCMSPCLSGLEARFCFLQLERLQSRHAGKPQLKPACALLGKASEVAPQSPVGGHVVPETDQTRPHT